MSLLTLDGVACSTPDGTPLFQNLTIPIDRQIVGLVGRNGAGKSTLLEAIAGERSVSAGMITRHGTIGFLRQVPPAEDCSIGDAMGAAQTVAVLRRIERGEGSEQDFAAADWTLPVRLEAALAWVGLPGLDLQRQVATLSGGEQTRVQLAALLLAAPDILLLDEPTNNLDELGRQTVIDLLDSWDGAALVASHDREVLRTVDQIIELTPVGVYATTGGWDMFEEQRATERRQAADALKRSEGQLKAARREQQRETEKQAHRDKRGRAAKAKDSEPRMFLHQQQQRAEKSASRYRDVGAKLVDSAAKDLSVARNQVELLVPVRVTLPASGLSSRHRLVEARMITCERNGSRLFGPLDLAVRGPERIALTGANGSGKTSLIRMVLGLESPASGEIFADTTRIGLLDQHLSLLSGAGTLADAVSRHNPDMTGHAVHEALAGYGFRNHWADRTVASLSGGERVRLALASLFSRSLPPQMLILDEPTNHLDLTAVELLEAALVEFDGAILCVSHDTAFRDSLRLGRTIALS